MVEVILRFAMLTADANEVVHALDDYVEAKFNEMMEREKNA